jgi:hypothetical protein
MARASAGGGYLATQVLDDPARLFDHRRVRGCELSLGEIDFILEADADMVDDNLSPRVHGVEVERADVGLQGSDVLDSLLRRQEDCTLGGELRVALGGHKAAARAGREIDNEVRIAVANAGDHVLIIAKVHRRLAGARFTHMDVGDGSAGLSGTEAGVGNLDGGDRQMRRLSGRGQITGDGTRNDDFVAGAAHVIFLVSRPRSI